jgi:iron complex transport system substrate-binding protein
LRWNREHRRIATLTIFALAAALAACGGAGGGSEGGGGGAAQARTVEHAMGASEIRGTPERIVVLDTGELDSAISLGVTPVGAVEAVEGMGLPSYLEGTADIENVSTIEEPNLEKIATLEPDLILSSKLRHEQIYDQLSQIAPTVFTETTGVTWKQNFEKHAEAMNRTAEAREVVDGYEERLEGFKSAMGDRLGETDVSVVRFLPGETRIYQKESFVGTVLEDAGLPRPPSQDVDEFAILNVSEEQIPKMDGDAVFVTVYGAPEDLTEERITSDPLWQRLDAVRQDRVYRVPDDLWMLGIGPTAAVGVVDDLEKHLV